MSVLTQAATEFRPTVLKDAVRRHVWLLVILALLGGGLGAAAILLLPTRYASSAGVLINPLYGNPFAPGGQGDQLTNLETEAQIVSSDAVSAIAAEGLGGTVPGPELARTVRGAVPANTQVVRVTSTAASAAVAQQRAQAFAVAFLKYRQTRTKTLLAGEIKLLNEQATNTRALLAKATKDMAAQPPDSANRALFAEQVRGYSAELARLSTAIAEKSATSTDAGSVISPASLPAERRPIVTVLGAIAGLLLGLGIGVLGAITRERLDDRIRDESDLDRLHIGWLGSLADAYAVVSPDQAELPEDVRRLRTVLLSGVRQRPVVVVVGRADSSEQGPDCVRSLAVALSRSGVRVCLVTAGSRGRAEVAVDQGNLGLAGLLLYRVPLEQVIEHMSRNLATIPRGRWNGAVSDLLGGGPTTDLLRRLRQDFDIVIIAAPSLDSADGRLLAGLGDVVVVEATALHTTNAQVLRVADQLHRADVPLLGGVIVAPRRRRRWSLRRRRAMATGPGVSATHQSPTRPLESMPPAADQTADQARPPAAVRPERSLFGEGRLIAESQHAPDTVAISVKELRAKTQEEDEGAEEK